MAEERLEIILEADVGKATAQIDKFSNNLGKTLPAATSKAAAGLDKLGKSAANANPTLVNFGRVVQDAPFGLIGIANNIDPLISSFQSLKTSTGSAGGALKALGGALLGPAGIGIAVSAVTSALIAFGPQIKEAITGVGKFGTVLSGALSEGAKAAFLATLNFEKYITVINDSGATLAQQETALKKINGLLDDYGIKINTVADAQKIGTEVIKLYAEAQRLSAIQTAFANAAADEIVKKTKETTSTTSTAIGRYGLLAFEIKKAFTGKSIEKANVLIDTFTKKSQDASNEITGVVEQIKKLNGVSEISNTNSGKAQVLTQNEVKVKKEKIALLNEELLLVDELLIREQNRNRIAALATSGPANTGAGQAGTITRGIDPAIGEAQKNFDKLQENAKTTANIIGNTLGPAIDSVFNAIANGENIFKALGDSIKGLVIELVKAVAKAIILKAVLSAINLGTGGGGGVVGSILGGVFGGRAGGGAVTPGGGYIVGENGPEKFYPTQAGTIVPNTGGSGGTLTASISGNNLLFLLNQAGRNQRMNFG